jgi:Ca-activated chloride channel family protein
MNCQDVQEKLLAHWVGELDAAAAAELHQHLETCAACRAAAEETERVLDLMRSAFAAGPAAPARLDKRHRNRVLRAQFTWRGYRNIILEIAAVILVCVMLGGLLLPATRSARSRSQLTAKLADMKQREMLRLATDLPPAPGSVARDGSFARAAGDEGRKGTANWFASGLSPDAAKAPESSVQPARAYRTMFAEADKPVDTRDAEQNLARDQRRASDEKGEAFVASTRYSAVDRGPGDAGGGGVGGVSGLAPGYINNATAVEGLKQTGDGTIAWAGEHAFRGTVTRGNAVTVTKAGSGTLVFDGANTYSGGTIINAGAAQLGDGGGVVNLNGGTLAFQAGEAAASAKTPPAGPASGGSGVAFDFAQPGKDSSALAGWAEGDSRSGGIAGAPAQMQAGQNGRVAGVGGLTVTAGGTLALVTESGVAQKNRSDLNGVQVADNLARQDISGEQVMLGALVVNSPTPTSAASDAPAKLAKQGQDKLVPLRTELPRPMLAGTPKPITPEQFTDYARRVENDRLSEISKSSSALGDAPVPKAAPANANLYAYYDAQAAGAKRQDVERKEAAAELPAVVTTAPVATLTPPPAPSTPAAMPVADSLQEFVSDGAVEKSLRDGAAVATKYKVVAGKPIAGESDAKHHWGLQTAPAAHEPAITAESKPAERRLARLNDPNSATVNDDFAALPTKPTGAAVAQAVAANQWDESAAHAVAPAGGAEATTALGLELSSTIKSPVRLKGVAKGYGGRFGKVEFEVDSDAETEGQRKEEAARELASYEKRKQDLAARSDHRADADGDGLVLLTDAKKSDRLELAKAEKSELGRVLNEEVALEEKKAEQTELRKKLTEESAPTKPIFRAAGVNPFVQVNDQSFSTFSISVDSASFTLARRYLNGGQRPPPESVRTEEFVNYFDYGYAPPGRDLFSVHAAAARTPFSPPGVHLLKLGIKGRQFGREDRGANLTFLLDTSGSMNAPDRLGLAREALKLLVARLGPRDRVALVTFSSRARLALDFTPASEQQKIFAALDGIQAAGFTHLEGGLKRAYETAARGFVSGAANRVILMSDGVANVGADAAAELLAQVEKYRQQGLFCSVFGLGTGTYDDTMLQALASKGNGTYLFMDSLDEARRVFVDEFAATLNKIAADVKIQVEFNPRRVKQYRQLGYEQRQLKTEDFRNDAVAAGEVGSGQSVTALYQVELQGDAREPLGTVRVRGRNLETGRVEELERAITAGDLAPSFERTELRFRLAAAAAQFAEILRGSPYAEGANCADVAKVLRPVALELNLDQKVQELLRLVNAAGSAPQARE